MLDLAIHIVETKIGHFKPAEFKDQYEDALKDLLRKKQKGEKIERPKEREPSNVINLMDALRQSVKGGGKSGGGKASASARRTPAGTRTPKNGRRKRRAITRGTRKRADAGQARPARRRDLAALDLLGRDQMKDFQELADEAFRDLLKKHGRPAT